MSLIQIRDLNVIHNDHFLLKDVNFSVEQGDVISIIGPSGMGKSRLLRCIIGLDRPDSGSIIFNGQDICAPEADLPAIRKQIGMAVPPEGARIIFEAILKTFAGIDYEWMPASIKE